MRTVTKSLFLLVGLLLLLVGLGVLTIPLWGPPVFDRETGKALRRIGFSEADISLEQIGFSHLILSMERLRYHGVTVSDGSLQLGYHFTGLRRKELDQVTVAHPEVDVDLSYEWPVPEGGAEQDGPSMLEKRPVRFPIEDIHLNDAVLTLRRNDWARSFQLNAQLSGRERLGGQASLKSKGLKLEAQADVDWSDLSGRVTASAEVEALAELGEIGRELGLFTLPKGLNLTAHPTELSTELGFAEHSLREWNLTLRNKGATLSMATSRIAFERLNLNAKGDGAELGSLGLEVEDALVTASGASLESATLSVSVNGVLPDALGALASVSEGHITWSDGEGHLSGLEGSCELASLQPLASKGPQTLKFASIKQGEFETGTGQLQLNYNSAPEEGPPLKLEITTTALGGKIRVMVDGSLIDGPSLSIRVFLDSVQLGDIATLFPQFEGRIKGEASGELALRLEGTEISLPPGKLQLTDGTTGRFEYLRQGWLTQDPELDPEAFVAERDILDIMKDPRGAQALTELAMRDLTMSDFQLQVQKSETGDQSLVVEIKGNRTIKGVTVPVVLDVPIRGDVKETINAVFEFNSRM